jgi:hypothetical protein
MKSQTMFTGSYQDRDECPPSLAYARFLSWGWIIGGALVAVGLSFLLNMLMVSLGLSTFTVDGEGLTTMAITGYIAMLIGIIIVMFLAGMVAGCGAKAYGQRSYSGALHGFISWCLALLISIVFASAIGNFMTNNSYALAKGSDNAVTSPVNTEASSKTDASSAQKAVEHKDTATHSNINAQDTDRDENAQDSNKAENIATTSAHIAGGTMLALFILFLVAALASIGGGYAGANCGRKDNND